MPRAPTSEMTTRLREQAHEHPTVATITTHLPEIPDEGATEEGLYVETGKTPGLVVNGELRVSMVRVFSVGSDGRKLVGQLQAVREVDHPLRTWELRMYVHEPEHFATTEKEDTQAWFVRLLDLHYETTDAQAELPVGVPA